MWGSSPPSAVAQNCAAFADRQIRLADKLVQRGKYADALRALTVAADDCSIDSVHDKITTIVTQWNRQVRRSGTAASLSQFMQVVSSANARLPRGRRSSVSRQLIRNMTQLLRATVKQGRYSRAHRYCRSYSRYTDRTFALNYYCATAANGSQSYTDAIASYEWLLDNWDDGQTLIEWNEAADQLNALYLLTTRFDRAFELSKRLAIRNPMPAYLLSGLLAQRGQVLEPIVRTANVLFEGVTPDRALRHVRTELERVKFPPYVQSVYLMASPPAMDAAFYNANAAVLPDGDTIERAGGDASLLRATQEGTSYAWLLTPVDTGYFVVQVSQHTSPEESVLLEGLLENAQNDASWQTLSAYQASQTIPATGSAVATFLGATYLNGTPLEAYHDVFDTLKSLAYYCVQDDSGDVVASHQFERNTLSYAADGWEQSSNTPALYHHEVTLDGRPLQEVVWPTYDGEQWSGVIRIGINNENE